jgi:uncharacterized protein YceK
MVDHRPSRVATVLVLLGTAALNGCASIGSLDPTEGNVVVTIYNDSDSSAHIKKCPARRQKSMESEYSWY